MLSMLKQIKEVLLTVTPNVFHYEGDNRNDKYIVWAEEQEISTLNADNKKLDRVMQGTIDYFTKAEEDGIVDEIETALTQADISYRLNSIQYEDETKFIHYEWLFEVM